MRSARAYHGGGGSLGADAPRRAYYGTRNQLLAAERAAPGGALLRGLGIVALNLAHVLLTSPIPRVPGVLAVLRGLRDHSRGRYGP